MSNQNMNALPPANLHAMSNILRGAKALMNKVESGDYERGNVDPTAIDGGDPNARLSEAQVMQQGIMPSHAPSNPVSMPMNAQNMGNNAYESAVRNSGMPDAIKKVMIEQQIPQVNPYAAMSNTFSLDDVSDLIEEDRRPQQQQQNTPNFSRTAMSANNRQNQQPQALSENMIYTGGKTITINEDELRGMLKEMVRTEVEKVKKQLTEATIQKTIQTLIKEGKIAVKKKTRKA